MPFTKSEILYLWNTLVKTHLNVVRINIHNTQYFRLELMSYTIELEICRHQVFPDKFRVWAIFWCVKKKLGKKLYRAKFDNYFITICFSMMDRCLWQPLPGKFLTTETPPPTTQSTCRIVTFWLVHPNKGAFKYSVIALGGGGGSSFNCWRWWCSSSFSSTTTTIEERMAVVVTHLQHSCNPTNVIIHKSIVLNFGSSPKNCEIRDLAGGRLARDQIL